MDFGLLGDVTARQNGQPLALTRKQRAVLAVLLHRANSIVSRTDIARLAWGAQPGDTPRSIDKLVGDYVSRLRTAFQKAGIGAVFAARSPGYQLTVDAETVDWHRFGQLVERAGRARDATDLADAIQLFRQGLNLWRGPALADVGPSLDPLRVEMEALRLDAVESLATLELARGGASRVLPMLTDAVRAHPTRDGLVALQIRALTAAGRRDEAVAAYQRSYQLSTELGLDPDPAVKDAYQALLVGPSARPSGPSQLPLDTSSFTGRLAELDQLMAFAPGAVDTPHAGGPPVPGVGGICVVDGMAGVGKTALAIRAAHRLATGFPDAQLFLDLHGHSPNMARVEPAEALDRLLRSIGVAGDHIPPHLEDRASLYRTRLVGKRMLIVLDNAYNAEQVRLLLPGTAGCLVLITSRRRLTALDDAYPLSLETLPAADARTLLHRVAGPDRIRGQDDDVEKVIELCAGLPMAIRMIAAQLRNHPTWRVQYVADLLSDAQNPSWDVADGERGIAAAFRLSYRDLTVAQQRAFRLLGLVPGRDIDTYAAAALLGAPFRDTVRLLHDLLDAHLVGQQVEGRFRLHDLMRAFAAHLARRDSTVDGTAALARLLSHQLQVAGVAMDVLFPHERDRRPRPALPTSAVPDVSTQAAARAWLDTEKANLLAAAHHAADHGSPDHTRDMANTLYRYLLNGAHYADAVEVNQWALGLARGRQFRVDEAVALDQIGNALRRLGHYQEGLRHIRQAIATFREVGDRSGEAVALTSLGIILGLHGRYTESLYQLQRALLLERQVGNSANEANILANLGNIEFLAGGYDEALTYYRRSLRITVDIGDRAGEGAAIANLGEVYGRRGRHDLAAEHYQRALLVFSDIGDRDREATTLTNLGGVHEHRGEYELAVDCHQRALEIFRSTGHRPGCGEALSHLAFALAKTHEYAESVRQFETAFDIACEIGDFTLKTTVLNGLGNTLRAAGDSARALEAYRNALALARRIGYRHGLGHALEGMAELLQASGEQQGARRHWMDALEIYATLDVPEADRVQRRLIELNLSS
jgi:tetratricopeptide (TPR) repeat protein